MHLTWVAPNWKTDPEAGVVVLDPRLKEVWFAEKKLKPIIKKNTKKNVLLTFTSQSSYWMVCWVLLNLFYFQAIKHNVERNHYLQVFLQLKKSFLSFYWFEFLYFISYFQTVSSTIYLLCLQKNSNFLNMHSLSCMVYIFSPLSQAQIFVHLRLPTQLFYMFINCIHALQNHSHNLN